MENVLKKYHISIDVEKKFVAILFLPIAVIIVYTIIFRINLLDVFLNLNPYFVLSFFLAYIGQIGIVSLRDSKIANVDYITAFKARLFANGVSLIIPGAMGPDLARAVIYVKKGVSLDTALSLSLLESFYDVTVISLMFLVLFWFHFSPLDIILLLTAIGNIFFWFAGIGYVYGTSHYALNRIEQRVFSLKWLKPLEGAYLNGKSAMKERLRDKYLVFYSSLVTFLGYIVQSLPFYLISQSLLKSVLINTIYQVALLVPIPSAAGVAEISLLAVVPPLIVLQIRVLELLAYSLGLIFVKDISIGELRSEVKEIWKTI